MKLKLRKRSIFNDGRGKISTHSKGNFQQLRDPKSSSHISQCVTNAEQKVTRTRLM